MRVLIVHEVDYLEKVIYEIHEFTELLANSGHNVTFFHFQEGASRAKKNLFRQRRIHGRVMPESKIDLQGPHQFGVPHLDRLWATLSCIPAFFTLFRKNQFDVVLNYAVPTYGLQLLLVSTIFDVPFVQRALDSSHEIRRSIFKFPILWAEKALYRLSPLLSANNVAMKKYCDQLGNRSKPSVVNYPPLDLDHFSKVTPKEQLREKFHIKPDDQVITYMGSFFYFSGLPEALKSLAKSKSDIQSVKLLLIGGGEQEDELKKLVLELGLSDCVIFTGFVSFEELPRYLTLSTIAINTLEVTRVAAVAFPNKVLQYLACGLPVVSTRLEGLVSALDGLPNLFWENTPSDVMETAVKLSRTNELKQDVLETRTRLEELFSPKSATKSLEKSLQKAIEITKKNKVSK